MRVSTYKINIDDERVDDLQRRLRSTRWPPALDADSWEDGTSLAFLKELLAYWKDHFDWRAQETRLNTLPQFIAEIDDLSIHFVHQRGNGPSPLPLILTHGWPGSFFEMEGIIPMLADPAAHGADPADAFDVVVPSLPGYGFSQAPGSAGIGPYEISGLWLKLMQGLGYETFCLQGGDIGAAVSSWLAYRFPQNTTALHLNYIPGSYRPPLGAGQAPISTEEQAFLERAAQWADSEGAYAHMQGTKPQTLAYALTDSPIGLAAWISEKFQAWSDGDIRTTFSLDALLIEISIYWFSGTLDSSLRLYKESRKRPMHFKANERVLPPLGVAHFARELPQPPRCWVERVYDVKRWTEIPKGGHFAAMERPELLAEDIRAYFRPFRTR